MERNFGQPTGLMGATGTKLNVLSSVNDDRIKTTLEEG